MIFSYTRSCYGAPTPRAVVKELRAYRNAYPHDLVVTLWLCTTRVQLANRPAYLAVEWGVCPVRALGRMSDRVYARNSVDLPQLGLGRITMAMAQSLIESL